MTIPFMNNNNSFEIQIRALVGQETFHHLIHERKYMLYAEYVAFKCICYMLQEVLSYYVIKKLHEFFF